MSREKLEQLIEQLKLAPQDWTVAQLVQGLETMRYVGDRLGWFEQKR